MEGSLVNYQNLTPHQVERRIRFFVNKVKQCSGQFVFLWHNSSFGGSWREFEDIYEKVVCGDL